MGWALVVLGTLLLALGGWASSDQSLAQALRLAQQGLALNRDAPSPLTVEGAEGSLLRGGRIQRLRWQQADLSIDIQQLELHWPADTWLQALRGQAVVLHQLQAQTVHIQDDRPPSPDPLTPPTSLALPWLNSLSVPVQAQNIRVQRQGLDLTLGPLEAQYQYTPPRPNATDGPHHELRIDQLRWAQGNYQAQARLQAQAPMALSAEWRGQALTHLPGGTDWTLDVAATATGTLATPAAQLQTTLRVDGALPAGPPTRTPPRLQASATVRPWAQLPVHSGTLALQDIDLAALWPQAPQTRLRGEWTVTSSTEPTAWQLQGELHNSLPGPWDRQALPLTQLQADLRLQDHTWRLHTLQAKLAGGQVTASGSATLRPQDNANTPWLQRLGPWQGELTATGVQPSALFSQWDMAALNLKAHAQTDADATNGTRFELAVTPHRTAASAATQPPAPQAKAEGTWNGHNVRLQHAELKLWDAQAQGQGQLDWHTRRFEGQAQLRLPGASSSFQGVWSPHAAAATRSQAQVDVQNAALLQQWVHSTWRRLERALPGKLPPLPTPLQDHTLEGQALLTATWFGAAPTWPPANPAASWNLRLQVPHLALRRSQADASHTTFEWQQAEAELNAQGTQLTLRHTGAVNVADWATQLELQAHTQWPAKARSSPQTTRLRLDTLTLQARHAQHPLQMRLHTLATPELLWHGGTDVTLQPGQLQMQLTPLAGAAPGTLSPHPLVLAWDTTRWQHGLLTSRGQARSLALSWLNAWWSNPDAPQGPLGQAGLQGDLMFDGTWDIALPLAPTHAANAPPKALVTLKHTQGDLSLLSGEGVRGERLAAGLKQASARLDLTGNQLDGQLQWVSQNAGQVNAQLQTTLTPPSASQPHWDWAAAAPVQGRVQAQLPQIGLWSQLAPTGWRMRGRLQADATLSGTRSQPLWQGQLQANDLALRSLLDGLEFSDGQMRATLAGDTVKIDSLRLRGAGGETGGWLLGSGTATWSAPTHTANGARRQPVIDLTLQAQQLRLLARADRRLTVSGQLDAQLRGSLLKLSGRLQADQALFLLPDDSTPTLGDDVIVRGQTPPEHQARRVGAPVQTQLAVTLLLGDNFRVRGRGIDTYLTGRLQLNRSPTQLAPQLTGQVRTVHGNYWAYGQTLNIEEGVIRFNGPYDNPTLDILALRPHPTQQVGVQISGTAQAPRVRLYAEPDMPDSEKLAWLVLGRSASGTGAEAAVLQQAAIALLSGQGSANDRFLNRALGLDELSFQRETRNSDGTTTAAAVTLGKRISQQLYVSYSRSLVGAMGTVAVLYDVSRYLTLRAQAGDDNAVDVIFTHKYD